MHERGGDLISLYRNRLAREKGPVHKDPGGKLRVALAYPNAYRLGMGNLGFQVVYGLLNEKSDVAAERAFLPEGQELSLYLRSERPLLTLESQTPVRDFDLVAFALSFENDYPNLLAMLDLAGIPLLEEERSASASGRILAPLILAGGIATFLNPEPVAPFIDLFLLGEAEVHLSPFLDLFVVLRRAGLPREELLLGLSQGVSGVYVPSLYQVEYEKNGVIRAFFPKHNAAPERIQAPKIGEGAFSKKSPAQTCFLVPEAPFGDRTIIEMGRGCPFSCRFCAAGHVYRPPRFSSRETLQGAIHAALDHWPHLALLSAAVSSIPGIEDLAAAILQAGGDFSVASLRADSLTPGLLQALWRAKQKTVTLAPEAGSERLRRVINKHLTREQIVQAVQTMARIGPFHLKLYFMVGLPTESLEDADQIVDLVKTIKHHMVKESAPRGSIGRITLSVNAFVPKPFTPFQWFPLEEVESLKNKQRRLKKAMAGMGGVAVHTDVPKWAYLQTLLSLGDRRVARILHTAHQWGGDWKKAFRHSDINPDFFVYRPRDLTEKLPWDFIDHGLSKAHLIHEREQALLSRESEICHPGHCLRCGVCGQEAH